MAKDNALISRAQTGDEGAFTELMRSYYAFVYGIVIRIVKDSNDAEEIVQDTFFNAYRGLAQLEDTNKFKGWLTKIARNRALNWLREQRVDTVSVDEVDELTLQMSESPDEGLIRDEQRELIRRAMGTLSETDREIARSYYLDGASYDELIRTHGLSYKAISFRLTRAKQRLAKRLSHLLTGVFAFPASTLKQIYSGGLTVMKVGTVPKITAGAAAIIVIAFIGTRQFISSRENPSPSVVVVASTPNESANSVSQRDDTRKDVVAAPSREGKPQISAEEMQRIENFFAELNESDAQSEADNPQSLTGTDLARDTDERLTTDTDAFAEDIEHSAEEVMNDYVEAFRNMDFEAMRELLTGAAMEEFESTLPLLSSILSGELPEEFVEEFVNGLVSREVPEEMIDEALQMMRGTLQSTLKQVLSQAEIVGSEYVADEFRFRLRSAVASISGNLSNAGTEMTGIELEKTPDTLVVKMRKVDGKWRIYGMQ